MNAISLFFSFSTKILKPMGLSHFFGRSEKKKFLTVCLKCVLEPIYLNKYDHKNVFFPFSTKKVEQMGLSRFFGWTDFFFISGIQGH